MKTTSSLKKENKMWCDGRQCQFIFIIQNIISVFLNSKKSFFLPHLFSLQHQLTIISKEKKIKRRILMLKTETGYFNKPKKKYNFLLRYKQAHWAARVNNTKCRQDTRHTPLHVKSIVIQIQEAWHVNERNENCRLFFLLCFGWIPKLRGSQFPPVCVPIF